jgi:hypothetical protein
MRDVSLRDVARGNHLLALAGAGLANDYDVSFEVDQVRRGYDQMMKAWRAAPARRAGSAWSGQLDRELDALGDPVTALARVNTGERAAERVRQVTERVRPLLAGRESQLPGPMLEGWQRMSGGVRDLGKP